MVLDSAIRLAISHTEKHNASTAIGMATFIFAQTGYIFDVELRHGMNILAKYAKRNSHISVGL